MKRRLLGAVSVPALRNVSVELPLRQDNVRREQNVNTLELAPSQ